MSAAEPSTRTIATTALGCFVVNLGPLAKIPPGESRLFQVARQSIAVFHTRENRVVATEPACPHKAGPLAGDLIGGQTVMCPLHGFAFDLCRGVPLGNSGGALKIYPTTVSANGDILVGIDGLLASR